MNCTDINTHKDDFLDGNMASAEKQAFEAHLADCENCAEMMKGMNLMLSNLKDLSVPDPSPDFEARVFAEVRRQHPKQQVTKKKARHHFVAGFTTAMAAGFALWFVSTLFIVQQQSLDTPGVMSVALNEAQTVRLLFDAPKDLDAVTLKIDLPANVQLAGYTGQSQLSWQTSLKKGQNVLALPIMAIDKGTGEMIAQLSYGDKVKTFRLVLKTADNGVMNYEIQPLVTA